MATMATALTVIEEYLRRKDENARIHHKTGVELEVKFDNEQIDRKTFEAVSNRLRQQGFVSRPDDDVYMLRVTSQDAREKVRVEFQGLDKVSAVCNGQPPEPDQVLHKERVPTNGYFNNEDFGLSWRVNTETEVPLPASFDIKSKTRSYTYRLLHRVSLRHPKYPTLRVDMTVVKTKSDASTPKQVFQQTPGYEIEVEYDPAGAALPALAEQVASMDMSGGATKRKAEPSPSEQKEQKKAKLKEKQVLQTAPPTTYTGDVLTIYNTFKPVLAMVLCGLQGSNFPVSVKEQNQVRSEYLALSNQSFMSNAAPRVLGPDAMTLTVDKMSMLFAAPDGYTVTDKADGERRSIMLAKNGRVYLLARGPRGKLAVAFSGITLPAESRHHAQTIMDAELVLSDKSGVRLNKPNLLVFDIYIVDGKQVFQKPLHERLDLISQVLTVFTPKEQEQPLDLPYTLNAKTFRFGSKEKPLSKQIKDVSDEISQPDYLYRTDGLILTPTTGIPAENMLNKRWGALFKYKTPTDTTFDFQVQVVENNAALLNQLTVNLQVLSTETRQSNLTLFAFNGIVFENVVIAATTHLGEPINNKDIVEFSIRDADKYNTLAPNHTSLVSTDSITWLPMRLRRDKQTPNADFVAVSNLQSVLTPVDFTVYYRIQGAATDKRREEFPYKEYHNDVKAFLLLQLDNSIANATHVLDITIGAGGDLQKYGKMRNLQRLVGVDRNLMGLQEAQRRLSRNKSLQGKDVRLVQLDSTDPGLPLQVGEQQFDVVTAFFSLHYMFESVDKICHFMTNVAKCLKPGGFFIGTCFDGQLVLDTLRETGMQRFTPNRGHTYTLVKQWDDANLTNLTDDAASVGLKLKVESATMEDQEEWLVSFTFLDRLMTNLQFSKVESKPFAHYRNSTKYSAEHYDGIEDKKFTQLNRTFVYQRNPSARMDDAFFAQCKSYAQSSAKAPAATAAKAPAPATATSKDPKYRVYIQGDRIRVLQGEFQDQTGIVQDVLHTYPERELDVKLDDSNQRVILQVSNVSPLPPAEFSKGKSKRSPPSGTVTSVAKKSKAKATLQSAPVPTPAVLFSPGDLVQVIKGPREGQVGEVTGFALERVYVNFGDNKRENTKFYPPEEYLTKV